MLFRRLFSVLVIFSQILVSTPVAWADPDDDLMMGTGGVSSGGSGGNPPGDGSGGWDKEKGGGSGGSAGSSPVSVPARPYPGLDEIVTRFVALFRTVARFLLPNEILGGDRHQTENLEGIRGQVHDIEMGIAALLLTLYDGGVPHDPRPADLPAGPPPAVFNTDRNPLLADVDGDLAVRAVPAVVAGAPGTYAWGRLGGAAAATERAGPRTAIMALLDLFTRDLVRFATRAQMHPEEMPAATAERIPTILRRIGDQVNTFIQILRDTIRDRAMRAIFEGRGPVRIVAAPVAAAPASSSSSGASSGGSRQSSMLSFVRPRAVVEAEAARRAAERAEAEEAERIVARDEAEEARRGAERDEDEGAAPAAKRRHRDLAADDAGDAGDAGFAGGGVAGHHAGVGGGMALGGGMMGMMAAPMPGLGGFNKDVAGINFAPGRGTPGSKGSSKLSPAQRAAATRKRNKNAAAAVGTRSILGMHGFAQAAPAAPMPLPLAPQAVAQPHVGAGEQLLPAPAALAAAALPLPLPPLMAALPPAGEVRADEVPPSAHEASDDAMEESGSGSDKENHGEPSPQPKAGAAPDAGLGNGAFNFAFFGAAAVARGTGSPGVFGFGSGSGFKR